MHRHKWINLGKLYKPHPGLQLRPLMAAYYVYKVRGCDECLKVQCKHDDLLESWRDCKIIQYNEGSLSFHFNNTEVFVHFTDRKGLLYQRFISEYK